MTLLFAHVHAYEIVFIDPVVNLCSEKLSTYGNATQALYDEQPFSGSDGAYDCMRTAQTLFNEVGTVIAWDKKTHEICVELHHVIIDKNGVKKHPQFWCWDTHIIQKRKLKKSALLETHYLILREPWCDTTRNITYSAGTRFARAPENDTEDGYAIQLFAPELKKNILRVIPVSLIVIPDASLSCEQRRLTCRDLLRSWIMGCGDSSEIIPYVWGGASYINRLPEKTSQKKEGSFFDYETYFWTRNAHKAYGFDCSSLIFRAAQIMGIPYYYKTSRAAFVLGTAIHDIDQIAEGDLIVWPGHMAMISDLKKGLLIESKGYDAGFGKVQELHLSRRFKHISSYKKLFEAYKQATSLEELGADRSVIKTIPPFKIISLCS